MIARLRHVLALGLFATLSQCAPKDPTGLYLTINIDPMISRQVLVMVVSVFNASTNVELSRTVLGRTTAPQYTVFVDESGRANKVRVEVEGFDRLLGAPPLPSPGSGVVLDRAVVTYTADQVLDVAMNLSNACRGMPCPPDCSRGPCVDQRCVPMTGTVGPVQSGMCVPATVPTSRHNY